LEVVTTSKLVITSTKILFRFPTKELGNDSKGLIIHVIPEGFYRGSSSCFTTTFGVVTDIDAVAGTACYPDIGFSDLGIFNLFCFVALKYVRDIIKV